MDARNELISYLETLKNGFDSNNPLHLKGLLYIIYCDATIEPKDAIFTEEVMQLIETVANNTNTCCNNAPVNNMVGGPRYGVVTSPIYPWSNEPTTIEDAFMSSGSRSLFGDFDFFEDVSRR